MDSLVKRALQRLHNSIKRQNGRGVIKLLDDSGHLERLQVVVLNSDPFDAERLTEYGFASKPHPDAECVVAATNGSRSNAVIIATDDRRYRLKTLQTGEVALYDDLGNVIKLGREQIEINAVQHLTATAPTMAITATTTHNGNVTIDGNLNVTGTITNGLINITTHTHTDSQSGTTSGPQ